MKIMSTVAAAALLASAAPAAGWAQTPTQSPDPSAASSPHQRQATGNDTSEQGVTNGSDPSIASSPHQREAMKNASGADTDNAASAGATPATFVKDAAQDGMAEIALAKVALEKSQNDEVKKFAQRMEEDHSQANDQLATVARAKGLSVPKQMDAKHEALVKMMSAKSGAAFDKSYADHMAKDHTKAVALFQAASQSSDPELASFAKKTLPTLEEHKQMADSLRSSVGTRTASAE